MKRLHYFVLFCFVSFLSTANGVEPVATVDLLEQCANHERNPASLETARCRSYLQGYMGGAYAMRTVSVTDPDAKKSKFMERAERTRLGASNPRYGMDRNAGYCVAQELTISELVARLNRFAAKNKQHSTLANQFVLDFLRAEFACTGARK